MQTWLPRELHSANTRFPVVVWLKWEIYLFIILKSSHWPFLKLVFPMVICLCAPDRLQRREIDCINLMTSLTYCLTW